MIYPHRQVRRWGFFNVRIKIFNSLLKRHSATIALHETNYFPFSGDAPQVLTTRVADLHCDLRIGLHWLRIVSTKAHLLSADFNFKASGRRSQNGRIGAMEQFVRSVHWSETFITPKTSRRTVAHYVWQWQPRHRVCALCGCRPIGRRLRRVYFGISRLC